MAFIINIGYKIAQQYKLFYILARPIKTSLLIGLRYVDIDKSKIIMTDVYTLLRSEKIDEDDANIVTRHYSGTLCRRYICDYAYNESLMMILYYWWQSIYHLLSIRLILSTQFIQG
jgi:hypothetical protein